MVFFIRKIWNLIPTGRRNFGCQLFFNSKHLKLQVKLILLENSSKCFRMIDLLPYPQSDLSCDSHLKQLMKTVPYVKLHFIQFSRGWKVTLKMFCLSGHFPLGAKDLMIYNPSWRFYGMASQSKHFSPLFYITLTNRNAEPFNYRARLTHPESQIFWRHLAEGEKCTESQSYLSRQWHQGN